MSRPCAYLNQRPHPACMDWSPPEPGQDYWEWQAGRCAGCCNGCRAPIPLVLDHDHNTGLVRGYLCRSCNNAEGRSDAPRWRLWRSGWNPAALLGIEEKYGGWNDHTTDYFQRTEPTEGELRAAIDLLGA